MLLSQPRFESCAKHDGVCAKWLVCVCVCVQFCCPGVVPPPHHPARPPATRESPQRAAVTAGQGWSGLRVMWGRGGRCWGACAGSLARAVCHACMHARACVHIRARVQVSANVHTLIRNTSKHGGGDIQDDALLHAPSGGSLNSRRWYPCL